LRDIPAGAALAAVIPNRRRTRPIPYLDQAMIEID
jgi:hypothetical protein